MGIFDKSNYIVNTGIYYWTILSMYYQNDIVGEDD